MAGGMHGRRCAWLGACAWQEYVCDGGLHGRGHAWQGACMTGACVVRGMHGGGVHSSGGVCGGGHAWQGGVSGWRGQTWQERQLLQRTVRILQECILVLEKELII